MAHTHSHDHSHDHSGGGHSHDHSGGGGHDHGFSPGHHHHPVDLKDVNQAFVIGIVLNFLFVIIEASVGLYIHSLSLLSDAGHNLADVASLAMSLIAIRLLKVRPTEKYTYGYKKTTILVALLNAAILLLSLGAIGYEALHRLMSPEPLPGKTISIVAAIGIAINAVTALLFLKGKDKDLNIRSAFLHLLSDAIVSAALVIGGIIIFYTHLYWIDSVLSLLVAIVILFSSSAVAPRQPAALPRRSTRRHRGPENKGDHRKNERGKRLPPYSYLGPQYHRERSDGAPRCRPQL
ncbi:cation diffusion facilitator family transporter [Puia sp. P3]|uniref:cation diffusion facilitator family transporter n=1 Tax=Puia sp. P3 TaxID=3423952 RepID=UPI003D67FD94